MSLLQLVTADFDIGTFSKHARSYYDKGIVQLVNFLSSASSAFHQVHMTIFTDHPWPAFQVSGKSKPEKFVEVINISRDALPNSEIARRYTGSRCSPKMSKRPVGLNRRGMLGVLNTIWLNKVHLMVRSMHKKPHVSNVIWIDSGFRKYRHQLSDALQAGSNLNAEGSSSSFYITPRKNPKKDVLFGYRRCAQLFLPSLRAGVIFASRAAVNHLEKEFERSLRHHIQHHYDYECPCFDEEAIMARSFACSQSCCSTRLVMCNVSSII